MSARASQVGDAPARLADLRATVDDVIADLRSPIERWRVWALMAGQDITIRYKRSAIGPFWVSITMACFVLGVGVLYSQIFHQPIREYLIYLGCGLLAWFLIVGLITEGAQAVIESSANLRSIPLPIPLLVARAVWRNVVVFLHNAAVIVVMILLLGHKLPAVAALAVVGVALVTLIGFFLGITLAPFSTRYRDVPLIITSVLQVLFFLTPIHWTIDRLPGHAFVTDANPFYHLIAIIRQPLMGETPAALSWIVALGLLAGAALLSVASLAITRKKIHLWL